MSEHEAADDVVRYHLHLLQGGRVSGSRRGGEEDRDTDGLLSHFPWRTMSPAELAPVLEILSQSTLDVLDESYLARRIDLEVDRHASLGLPLTCLVLGLNQAGHDVALHSDLRVIDLAQLIRRSSRRSDLVARYTGGAVTLVLSSDDRVALRIAQRLLKQWEERVGVSDLPRAASLCVGVASLTESCPRGEDLLNQAYLALHRARERGPYSVALAGGMESADESLESMLLAETFPASLQWLGRFLDHRHIRSAIDTLSQHPRMDVENASRVADGAVALAASSRLSQEDQAVVGAAALVRDVGMTHVPTKILSHNGPLQHRWRKHITDHPVHSTELVRRAFPSRGVEQVVLHHHEWMDGTGYPSRLAGDSIPIGARIISVVDAYVAMTSQRAYRPAFSQAQAFERLRYGAGSQFDPSLVHTFLSTATALHSPS